MHHHIDDSDHSYDPSNDDLSQSCDPLQLSGALFCNPASAAEPTVAGNAVHPSASQDTAACAARKDALHCTSDLTELSLYPSSPIELPEDSHHAPKCPLVHISEIDPGTTLMEDGISFGLNAEAASLVQLCLFDSPDATEESARYPMSRSADGRWTLFLDSVEPGQCYGYRVYGPWNPDKQQYFNPNKILLDPYTHAVDRSMRTYDTARFQLATLEGEEFVKSVDNNADVAPKSVVIDDEAYEWHTTPESVVERGKRVIVELHPRGATALHPGIPEDMRGTYAAMAHPAFLADIVGTCNTVQLVIQASGSEPHLLRQGLTNYWGYAPLGAYFAPSPDYAYTQEGPQAVIDEVKYVVDTLRSHGIEVFIDVVYNHTIEGGSPMEDPTFSLRAIDNRYYLTDEHGTDFDLTGCGNSIDMDFKLSRALALDSLRYWRNVMNVAGIRYDLATVLGATDKYYSNNAPFYVELNADESLNFNNVSESWGGYGYHSGYQVGNVPMDYEWNGPYQDVMRQFWGGLTDHKRAGISEFSHMFAGTASLFQHKPHKDAASSVNYFVAHDGFTLYDLVSYNEKHNLANGEQNRDGKNGNNSWNTGAEGATDNPHIMALRVKRAKAMMASLFLSQGTPMYSLGDLVLNTQHGNNNVYCQDNDISHVKWEQDITNGSFKRFIAGLYDLKQTEPLLHRTKFDGSEGTYGWYNSDGHYMPMWDWHKDWMRNINVMLVPAGGVDHDTHGLFVAVNASHHDIQLRLPDLDGQAVYEGVFCSSMIEPFQTQPTVTTGQTTLLPATSVMLFRVRRP